MSEVMEYAARLSDVIGARPGGTEEEQQASFFIEEVMANKASLETSVEEFNCNPNYELPRIICCIVSIVLALLAIILDLMVIPAFIVTLIMAALYILEVTGLSPLNNVSKRGISQNVVGRYIPGAQQNKGASLLGGDEDVEGASSHRTGARKRKIVLIARYDSGKVCRELQKPFFGMLTIIKWAEIAAIALIPIVLLIRMVSNAEGPLLIALNIILIIAAVISFIPVVIYIIHQTASYSDGANNNASGVAVMLEVAKRISEGFDAELTSEALLAATSHGDVQGESALLDAGVTMHGENELLASGMVPEGTELVYGAEQAHTIDLDQAEGLQAEGLDQGAAVGNTMDASADQINSAMTSQFQANASGASAVQEIHPVGSVIVGGNEPAVTAASFATGNNAATGSLQSNFGNTRKQQDNVPDWFKKGIEAANAKKEAQNQGAYIPDQRSRFAEPNNIAAQTSVQSNVQSHIQEVPATYDASSESPARMSQSSIEAAAGEMLLDGSIQTVENAAIAAARINYGENMTIEDAMRESDPSAVPAYPAERTSVTGRPLPAWPPAPSDDRDVAVMEAASTLEADVAQAKERINAAQAQAVAEAAEGLVEQTAILDRTISYIPVAADIPSEVTTEAVSAISTQEGSVAETLAKTPGEILAEASSLAEDGDFAAAAEEELAKEETQSRKKRSIDLPSLTGAIGSISEKKQAAPLAESDSAEGTKKLGGQKRSRRLKASNIPSPTDAVVKSVRSETAIAVAEEPDSATSIATNDAKGDAAKALSSLDVVNDDAYQTAKPSEKSDAVRQDARQHQAPHKKKKASRTNALPVIGINDAKLPTVNTAGSFGVGSQTGSFEPVGEELIADMVEDDIIVQDVDDSAYQKNVTSTGAYAGPGYVNMPKSRADRIKGIFGRKKSNGAAAETSFAEAIGIDSNYDARKVGTERGGWESFKDESANYNPTASSRHSHIDHYSSNSRSLKFEKESWDDGAWSDDEWNGGAFSLNRKGDSKKSRNSGLKEVQRRKAPGSMLSELAAEAADEVNAAESAYVATSGSIKHVRASDMPRDLAAANNGVGDPSMGDIIDEREKIRSFRTSSAPLTSFSDVAAFASSLSAYNDDQFEEEEQIEDAPKGLQTEVWFVALGAELADNAGIKAFLADHAEEMRGSIIIELDALGAGNLSLIETEGTIKHTKITARMKRYATKAAAALGIKLNNAKMEWRDSAAYFAASRGFQTIHVAGMTDGKPTYMGEADDTYENLNEDSLMEGIAFTLELIHSI